MAIGQHASVKDIRLVLDKFTGAPRGFAFVHFHTVADASRVLHALQVCKLHQIVGWLICKTLLVWLTNTLIGSSLSA
jgi:RNA recognition motif-containing protein